jgi:hypothetical protein
MRLGTFSITPTIGPPLDARHLRRLPLFVPCAPLVISCVFLDKQGRECHVAGTAESVARVLRMHGFRILFSSRSEDQP